MPPESSAVALATLGRVAGAFVQSRERFGVSLLLAQSHNWVLLATVPIVLLLAQPHAVAVGERELRARFEGQDAPRGLQEKTFGAFQEHSGTSTRQRTTLKHA